MEVSQFTYFQQVGGIECDPASTELTYGLERLAMYVQGVESVYDLDTRYLFEINSRWTIDGATRRNRARYINHSCRPNAEVYFIKHAIRIRAIRNIKAGEEITYHYGRNYFEAFIKPAGCKCLACARKRAKQRAQARAGRRQRRARDGAFELADVARPWVRREQLERFARECLAVERHALRRAVAREEPVRENRNVHLALAQRWKPNRKRVDAVIQVLAEP